MSRARARRVPRDDNPPARRRPIRVSADKATTAARALRDDGCATRARFDCGADARRGRRDRPRIWRLPGFGLEDSVTAARIGEIGAHLVSAVALVLPGIGPIVADGPLAAGLAEAAGHVAGGIARTLERRDSIGRKPRVGVEDQTRERCSLARMWMPYSHR